DPSRRALSRSRAVLSPSRILSGGLSPGPTRKSAAAPGAALHLLEQAFETSSRHENQLFLELARIDGSVLVLDLAGGQDGDGLGPVGSRAGGLGVVRIALIHRQLELRRLPGELGQLLAQTGAASHDEPAHEAACRARPAGAA